MKYAVFIGRWQPVHRGHEWLIRQKLSKGIPCLIFIRDTPPDESNPYTTVEVASLLAAAFEGENVLIRVIPDIESVNWDGECPIQGISATKIRDLIKNGQEVSEFVSPRVEAKLKEMYHAAASGSTSARHRLR